MDELLAAWQVANNDDVFLDVLRAVETYLTAILLTGVAIRLLYVGAKHISRGSAKI